MVNFPEKGGSVCVKQYRFFWAAEAVTQPKGSPLPVAASAAHTKAYITAYNKIHDKLQVLTSTFI